MRHAGLRFGLALLTALLGAGCALREPRPEGAWLDDRLDWFRARPEWQVQGRLGLSDGDRAGSLALTWRADGQRHDIALRTFAGGRQWRLRMRPGHAVLTGSEVGRIEGPDPDALVRRAVGWPIPVRHMSAWLRGLPAPDGARTGYDEDGLLASLQWDGWALDYRRWSGPGGTGVLLPSRVDARSGRYEVRAALRDWQFAAPAAGAHPRGPDESL